MSGPTILEFARIVNAAYDSSDPLIPTYTRVYFGTLASGFKAARYVTNAGGTVRIVVSFAGTDFDMADGPADILSDIGFAGAAVATTVGRLSPALGMLVSAGQSQLRDQISGALEFTRQAQYFAGPGSEMFLAGHSLGGGLAQIIAAQLGIKGMAFNAPAVSQMGYAISDASRFFNINNARDPVSQRTAAIGSHLGSVITIDNGANGMDAHLIVPIVSWLESGPGAATGSREVF